MPLAIFTLFTGMAVEFLGSIVSIIGMTALLGANPIVMGFVVALDAGKLLVVSILYKFWKDLNFAMRTFAIFVMVVTMMITSAGMFSYLSAQFQRGMVDTTNVGMQVQTLQNQLSKYESRKVQIDQQIAALPATATVNQRLRLMNGFKAEQADLQSKIAAIETQLPTLQTTKLNVEAKTGPVLYMAKAFNIPVEEAFKWVIIVLVTVFDPLAVFLVVCGNMLLAKQQKTIIEVKPEEPQPIVEFAEVSEPIIEVLASNTEVIPTDEYEVAASQEPVTVAEPVAEPVVEEVKKPAKMRAKRVKKVEAEVAPEIAQVVEPAAEDLVKPVRKTRKKSTLPIKVDKMHDTILQAAGEIAELPSLPQTSLDAIRVDHGVELNAQTTSEVANFYRNK